MGPAVTLGEPPRGAAGVRPNISWERLRFRQHKTSAAPVNWWCCHARFILCDREYPVIQGPASPADPFVLLRVIPVPFDARLFEQVNAGVRSQEHSLPLGETINRVPHLLESLGELL